MVWNHIPFPFNLPLDICSKLAIWLSSIDDIFPFVVTSFGIAMKIISNVSAIYLFYITKIPLIFVVTLLPANNTKLINLNFLSATPCSWPFETFLAFARSSFVDKSSIVKWLLSSSSKRQNSSIYLHGKSHLVGVNVVWQFCLLG